MRHRPHLLVLLLLIAPVGATLEAQSELPPPVAAGLAAVRAGSYDSAVIEWTRTWPASEHLDSVRTTFKTAFARLVAGGNIPRGWELARQLSIGKTVRRYYVVVSGSEDPVFLVLEAYQRPDAMWTVDRIAVNSSLSALAPLDAAVFLGSP